MASIEPSTFYRHLCDHLGVALVATDPELNIRIWNGNAARMFGASAELMMGTPIASVFPTAYRDRAATLIRRAFSTGEAIPFEFDHRDDHGAARELIATFAPVVADDGERIGASAAIRDITRRIAMQRELEQNRTMAALGQLAGTVAHHFNNILGGIITSADFAAESYDAAVMRRVLEQIGRQLLRSSDLVHGLLAFSEGNQHAEHLSDFTEIVYTVLETYETSASESGVTMDLTLPRFPVMPFPRAQLTTVLDSIVKNALEATSRGGWIRIACQLLRDEVVVEVSDSGHGMDESARQHVFEPFWTTKTGIDTGSNKAVGLGLAIAHGMVQVMGGTIAVISSPGAGATFRVTLPRPDVC